MDKVILYTGNINRRYGIEILLSLFNEWQESGFYLWIRGSGEMKERIIEMEKMGRNVKYYPAMEKQELKALLKKADVLVNPVKPDQEFSKYFFPSKTMEYLASGTPVIMYHLDCIPVEYNEYLFYVDGNTSEDLQRKIIEVCNLSKEEILQRGSLAKAFILNYKCARVQIKRVLEFLETKIIT